jgi:GNAT superfamily N-acetyltransferase
MNSTNHIREIQILSFSPQWQDAAKALILAGLEEHLGRLDPTKNSDLNDITVSYAEGAFLLAVLDGVLIGTGAILPEGRGTMRIVRMSVARDKRRKGIGWILLQALLREALQAGCRKLVCETTDTWQEAISFYRGNGFDVVGRMDGEIHFVREIGRDAT